MFFVRSAAPLAVVACIAAGGLAAPTATANPESSTVDSALKSSARHVPASRPVAARSTTESATAAPNLDRIAGASRYLTAVEISKAHFPDGTWPDGSAVQIVTVASGDNYPDALAGGPFAAGLGPLLLVPATGTVPAGVIDEIERLAPEVIVILGSTGAVSAGVEAQLGAVAQTERLFGAGRYATAATIAEATSGDLGGADAVVISSGEGFADALSGGASAAVQSGVLMLTRAQSLPFETRDALVNIQPSAVQILGSAIAVSDTVLAEVQSALPAATVTRVSGPSRADTAAALSQVTFPFGTPEVFLTNGLNYPDALAAAPLAWFWDASVLLVRPDCAWAATVTEDARLAPDWRTALGSPLAVSDAAHNLNPC